MPNLQALVSEFDKLRAEVEDEARRVIDNELAATRARKQNTFDTVKKKVEAINGQLGEINQFFDALDRATNGPPTSDGSPVSAQPSEAAGLNKGTAG
jgi:replicative DNA helicase